MTVDQAGILRAVNAAWTRLLGWLPADLVGDPHLEIHHPDDRALCESALKDEWPIYETRVRHKDGSYRSFSWVAGHQDPYIYASGRDISDEKVAAAALAAAQEQLRQSQKMEAIGQLTGGIAHDFNNLLAGVIGSLELIEMRATQGRLKDIEKFVNIARESAKRAAALTNRLLSFARRQTLDPKPTDVHRLVLGMEELIRRTIGPSIRLCVPNSHALWACLVDPNQLDSALLNLCLNARDAMPHGGELTIETGNHHLQGCTAAPLGIRAGDYVSLCVRDSGSGMEEQIVRHAFEPFFTTKPLGEGTGLGLSMVYGLAQQSGGVAHIESKPSHGTTVCVYLPRCMDIAPVDRRTEASPKLCLQSQHQETILVVDDEPAVLMVLKEQIQELGYTTLEAADSTGALQVLRSNEPITLLITDVGLPGEMNGWQLAEAARSLREELKVLLITGYAETATLHGPSLKSGMRVLTKPFAMDALASRVREMVG